MPCMPGGAGVTVKNNGILLDRPACRLPSARTFFTSHGNHNKNNHNATIRMDVIAGKLLDLFSYE